MKEDDVHDIHGAEAVGDRSFTTGDEEIWGTWLDEAERRDRGMGEDPEAGAPADEVRRRLRSRLR